MKSALQDFVANYNSVESQVDGQIGPTAGVLTGDFLIREVHGSLRQLISFQGSGPVSNFSDLGLELSNTGALSLNTDTFDGLSDSKIDAGFTFAGSSVGGFGSLAPVFRQLSDPISGLIKIQQDQYETTSTRLSNDLAGITDKVALLQTVLSPKIAISRLATCEP